MKTASISEAKNRLSTYVDLAKRGETVVITDRGRPVARLMPLERSPDLDTEMRRTELERQGVIRRAVVRPRKDFLKRLPPAPKVEGDLLAALLAEREEAR